jgi:hypothetical protein
MFVARANGHGCLWPGSIARVRLRIASHATAADGVAQAQRAVALLAALAGFALLLLLGGSPASAAGCSDSWTNTAGGSWFVGGNWSTGAPPTAGEEACITAAGTYTVTLDELDATVSAHALTIGGASGRQTLAVNADTASAVADTQLKARGAMELAEDVQLTLGPGELLTNDGAIEAAGSGAILLQGEPLTPATFVEGTGSIVGDAPVIITNGTLEYVGDRTEHGSGPIVLRGQSKLKGDVQNRQTLSVQSTCSVQAHVRVEAVEVSAGNRVFTNAGRLEFNSVGCGNQIFFDVGAVLDNYGGIFVANQEAAYLDIEYCVLHNYNVIRLGATPLVYERRAVPTLTFSGSSYFEQASGGSLRTYIAGPRDYGWLSALYQVVAGGILEVHPVAPLAATAGEQFEIIFTNHLIGSFSRELETPANYTGLYYKPTYSPSYPSDNYLDLNVTQVIEARTPKSGPPGTLVTVSGSRFGEAGSRGPGGLITLTFTDSEGTKTVYPIVGEIATLYHQEFSTQIEIPASAAPGMGKITATSPYSDVHINKPFDVT